VTVERSGKLSEGGEAVVEKARGEILEVVRGDFFELFCENLFGGFFVLANFGEDFDVGLCECIGNDSIWIVYRYDYMGGYNLYYGAGKRDGMKS
jgi:hypothetical protein